MKICLMRANSARRAATGYKFLIFKVYDRRTKGSIESQPVVYQQVDGQLRGPLNGSHKIPLPSMLLHLRCAACQPRRGDAWKRVLTCV